MTDIVDLFNACLYIQDHLEADLSLLFLAQTVGLSRFRFHRVFKAWRGETLHDFVTRMRMERAAFELRYPIPRSSRRSIKAIAFASGYKSLSSFSHAFSTYAHLSPREFRNRALSQRPAGTTASPAAASFGRFSMRVSVEAARTIVVPGRAVLAGEGLKRSTIEKIDAGAMPPGDRFGVELLPNLLARARADGGAAGRLTRLSCVGVAVDPSDEHSDIREGRDRSPQTTIRLAGGCYAVLEGEGSFAQLYRTWRRGFDAWLAATGECPKPGRLYIRYRHAADVTRLALFIPLEELGTHLA